MMAKCLAGMDIGNMHFHGGHWYCRQGIGQRYGCMRIATGIDYHSIKGKSNLMYLINQGSFMVGLKVVKLYLTKQRFERLKIALKGLAAIYTGLPFSEQVEVGTIHYQDFFHD